MTDLNPNKFDVKAAVKDRTHARTIVASGSVLVLTLDVTLNSTVVARTL